MKPTVYVETSIISYLVGWLNRNDLQVAAHQELTRRWWTTRRNGFELFGSSLVLDEAADGDPGLAAERIRFLEEVALLRVSEEAHELKFKLLRRTQIPVKAENDALHIAVATVHGMEFLATWNCKHIANAVTLPLVYEVCRAEDMNRRSSARHTSCWEKPMTKTFEDPIVRDVHETRARLLAKYGGSEGYAEHVRQMEADLGDRVVIREPRPPVKTHRKVS